MAEIRNFSEPAWNDYVSNVQEAVDNRLEGIRVWATEKEGYPYRPGDLVRWVAGKFDATTSATIEAHLDAVKTTELSLLAAVQAIVDSSDTEDKIAAIGLIVRPANI